MRARNFKPGLFLNEILGQEDPMLTLVFLALMGLADREGIVEDRPVRIRAEAFPYRLEMDLDRYLKELSQHGFIQRYQVGDLKLLRIVNFEKHQRPHHTEKPSIFPKPNEANTDRCDVTVDSPLGHGGNPPDSLIPDSLNLNSLNHESVDPPPPSPSPSGRGRGKVERLGEYPEAVHEAMSSWRELLKALRNPDILESFPPEKRFLPTGSGTNEATWKAWQKRTSALVKGKRITDADMLEAIRMWASVKLSLARSGEKLAAPMLPTLINGDGFVDALVRVVEARNETEASDAAP
jgi:hypothetical protein